MKPLLSTLKSLTGFVTKYIGVIIIAFTIWACVTLPCLVGPLSYTSVFLGVAYVRYGALYSGQ